MAGSELPRYSARGGPWGLIDPPQPGFGLENEPRADLTPEKHTINPPHPNNPNKNNGAIFSRLAIAPTSIKWCLLMACCKVDGESIVRASAVLKSQGRENWFRGRPGPVWARANSRSVRDAACGEIRGKTCHGVTSYGATGPGCVWYSYLIANGGRDLPQYTKKRCVVRASTPTFAK